MLIIGSEVRHNVVLINSAKQAGKHFATLKAPFNHIVTLLYNISLSYETEVFFLSRPIKAPK